MLVSNKLKAFLGREEALVLVWFDDDGTQAGGFSHHDKTKTLGDPITQQEALDLLDKDCAEIGTVLSRAIKIDIAQHEFDAIASLAYNEGEGEIARSKLVERLNMRDLVGVLSAFMDYPHPGRRAREQAMYLTGNYGDLSKIPLYTKSPRKSVPTWIPWPGQPTGD